MSSSAQQSAISLCNLPHINCLEDPNILIKLQPAQYYQRWLEDNPTKRPDQRLFEEYRPLQIVSNPIGTAESSTTVRLGSTTIVTGIKAEVAEPALDESDCGFLVANVTLAAGCSPAIKAGPPTDYAQELSWWLSGRLHALVDRRTLTIVPRKLVWSLQIDPIVVDDSGNIRDAVWIAVMASLHSLRLPASVRMDADSGLVYANYDMPAQIKGLLPRVALPLSLVGMPQSDGRDWRVRHLADPSALEEAVFGEHRVFMLVDANDYSQILYLEGEGLELAESSMEAMLVRSPAIRSHLESLSRQLLL